MIWYCKRFGHIKRNCRDVQQGNNSDRNHQSSKSHKVNSVKTGLPVDVSSREEAGLVVNHALKMEGCPDSAWIVDYQPHVTCFQVSTLYNTRLKSNLEMIECYWQMHKGTCVSGWRMDMINCASVRFSMYCMFQNCPTIWLVFRRE